MMTKPKEPLPFLLTSDPPDPDCAGCIYEAKGRGIAGRCDYLQIAGHARILICGPGKECTVKVLKKKPRHHRGRPITIKGGGG